MRPRTTLRFASAWDLRSVGGSGPSTWSTLRVALHRSGTTAVGRATARGPRQPCRTRRRVRRRPPHRVGMGPARRARTTAGAGSNRERALAFAPDAVRDRHAGPRAGRVAPTPAPAAVRDAMGAGPCVTMSQARWARPSAANRHETDSHGVHSPQTARTLTCRSFWRSRSRSSGSDVRTTAGDPSPTAAAATNASIPSSVLAR